MFELEFDEMLVLKPEKEVMQKSLLEFSPICPTSMLTILDKDPHPSDLDLARFADAVKMRKTGADYKNTLPDGWLLLTTGSNPHNKKYFGAAFIHHEAQQVVVAHHETTEAINKDSSKMIRLHAVCINSATTFMNYIKEGIRVVNTGGGSYSLTITGHRLGGWLAQITAFTAKYLSIEDDLFKMNISSGLHTKTVVFDSPGARDLLNTVLDVYYDRYTMNVYDGLYITVYLSTQNQINTCGLHLGKVYSVSNNNDVNTEKGNLMKYFIDVFEKCVPELCEIVDWAKNENEFSFNKKTTNKDSKDDRVNRLSNKSHRQAKLNTQPNDENAWSHFNIFAEDELIMLFKLHIIQEQKQKVEIIIQFISKMEKEKAIEFTAIFPFFKMDSYGRIMHCESKKSLDELTKRLKQLMRFLKTQFTAAVMNQIANFPRAADLIYHAEGQSYLGSSPKSTLDFTDSIGLEDFLLSETLQILQLISQHGAFEMTRLQNLFFQLKNRKDLTPKISNYMCDEHHTFVKWPQLQKLYIFGLPIHQNDLTMVDCSSSPTMSEEDVNPLIKYLISSSTLKKLIIILSTPTDIFDSFENIKIEGIINFKNLSEKSQNIVFKRKKMIFTGNRGYSFQEFMGANSNIDDFNEFLPSDCLKNIATNEDYVINLRGTRLTHDSYPQMPLYKTNFKTSKNFILSCAESSNTNTLAVVSGLSHEELKNRASWEELEYTAKITLHQSDEDAKLSFYRMCNKNPEKCIYLLAVSGEDVYCKLIFNPGFYVSRKFFHRAVFDPQGFAKTNLNDDLVVIPSEKEKALLENYYMETKKSTEIIIAATKEREIEIIKKSFNKNIHFVKIDKKCQIIGNGSEIILEWRYSHGSAENLRHCVTMDSCESIDEATLALTERNIVILTDDPGTGKTTALASLSRRLESEWVIYIRLKNFKAHIEKLPEKLDSINVACFLLSECTHANSSLDKKLLEYLLENNICSRRIVVMFAGFDELEDYKDEEKDSAKKKIFSVFNFLKNKPTVQIFLTTRKYLKEVLELELGQISTSFKGISKQEQLDLLVKFWLSCPFFLELRDNGEEEKTRLEAHAGELLQNVKRVLGPDNDRFMGVPLHTKMLAEDFRPQSERQIDLISAPNLFKWLMILKFKIYYHDKVPLTIPDIYLVKTMDNFMKDHCKLGFRAFFPTFYDTHFVDSIKDERLMKFNRHGLLQSKGNGDFRFVYQTNAQYCCAQVIVRWLAQRKSNYTYPLIKEILVPKILLLPENRAIRWFMNAELNETPVSCDALELTAMAISELCLEASASVTLKNAKNETALHVAIHEKNEHIVKFLVSGSGSNSECSRRAFLYLIMQDDQNNDTPLNIVRGYLSNINNNSEDFSLFNRILKNILQRTETCS